MSKNRQKLQNIYLIAFVNSLFIKNAQLKDESFMMNDFFFGQNDNVNCNVIDN